MTWRYGDFRTAEDALSWLVDKREIAKLEGKSDTYKYWDYRVRKVERIVKILPYYGGENEWRNAAAWKMMTP